MTEFEETDVTRRVLAGRCAKCGRGFLTMPADRLDHYHCKVDGVGYVHCGGAVNPIERADGEDVKGASE